MVTIRIRSLIWFSAGLVLAVALLWTSTVWRAEALPGPEESTIVAVEPTRVLDTRDPTDLGLAGPFTSPTPQKLKVTGSIPTSAGTATVVPEGATGVLLNVTAVEPAEDGFLSIRPGDATGEPQTSSLNFESGAIVPNSVQVAVPTTGPNAGQIDITYSAFGLTGPTSDVLIDIVGYTTSSGLQELVMSQPIARSVYTTDVTGEAVDPGSIAASVTIEVPVDGLLTINGSALIIGEDTVDGGLYECRLTLGPDKLTNSPSDDLDDTDRREFVPAATDGFCGTNGAVAVTAGTHVVNLVVEVPEGGGTDINDATLDVVFFAGGTVTGPPPDSRPAGDDAEG